MTITKFFKKAVKSIDDVYLLDQAINNEIVTVVDNFIPVPYYTTDNYFSEYDDCWVLLTYKNDIGEDIGFYFDFSYTVKNNYKPNRVVITEYESLYITNAYGWKNGDKDDSVEINEEIINKLNKYAEILVLEVL
jgi:hypothetical protein